MKFRAKKIIYLTAMVLLAIFAVFGLIYYLTIRAEKQTDSFEKCAVKGYQITETYNQRQCITPSGRTFYEDGGNIAEKINMIQVASPKPNEIITSPVKITGQARGYWFLEGFLLIKIMDEEGGKLGEGLAVALSEWTTEDFVPFETNLQFKDSPTNKGVLILKKNNPSGLSGNNDELRMPVRFK